MLRTFLVITGVLSMALPTWAQSWQKNCQAGTNFVTTSLGPGESACYEPDDSAEASPVLTLLAVDNFDIQLWDDKDGSSTKCTVTYEVEGCPPHHGAQDASELLESCEILPGTTALTGDDIESNLAAVAGIRVLGDGAGANVSSCIVVIKGAAGANR